jgi:3-deoxy-D-manno-octulosonic-acid transferase
MRFFYGLYSLLLLLFLFVYLAISLLKDPSLRKYRRSLCERFGVYSPRLGEELMGSRPLWIHAVSVGETMAASSLVLELMKRGFQGKMVLSSVTATGNQVARERFPGAGAIVFFPLDFRRVVQKSLNRLQPRAVLLTETELWPHFLRACREKGIPCILINGRISETSFKRYRWAKWFFRYMVKGMTLLCMQSEGDLDRIIRLGADPARVHWTGNLKFDQFVMEKEDNLRPRWWKELVIEEGTPVFIAGSTHPGEEEAAIAAFLAVKKDIGNLVLLLAPRHPERLAEVERIFAQSGLAFCRRSVIGREGERKADAILLDTMGELSRMYSLGTVVFVGGSLGRTGGHNILEPAFYDRPILIGPHMENFREIAELFLSQEAALCVKDASDLAERLRWLLLHPQVAREMGERAGLLLRRHQGATQRTLDLLKAYL